MQEFGSHIGAYTVESEIGRGGMGVVYKATDSRLGRTVAIKALPEHFAADPDRLARFEREARTLASLNHPNVAGIYGVEEHDGRRYLILEFVEGESLADRLARSPLTPDEALDVGAQVAAGIEAAHEAGIIHRDLKPANIRITPDGRVKVLDFGLARADAATGSDSSVSQLPTMTSPAAPDITTTPGAILGTAPYMSPEQARGRRIDRRSDVWAFGVVMFESLTGRCPFECDTVSDTIASILKGAPEWSRLPSRTPPQFVRLLRKCLEPDIRKRKQSIGDVRVEIEETVAGDATVDVHRGRRVSQATVLVVGVAAALAGALLGSALFSRSEMKEIPPETAGPARSIISLPVETSIAWHGTLNTWSTIGYSRLIAASRDGQNIAITVRSGQRTSLYLKRASAFEPTEIAGTGDARGPFFSPDGQWLAFLAEGDLRKVRLSGGVPERICAVNSSAFDGAWLEDGTIVYSTDHGLMRVAASGGAPEQLTELRLDEGETGHQFPNPGPRPGSVFFTRVDGNGAHAVILDLANGDISEIRDDAADARIVNDRWLVFARGGEVLAARFDAEQPVLRHTATPIATGAYTTPGQGGVVVHHFATSGAGSLVFVPDVAPAEDDSLVWVDSSGEEELIVSGAGQWMHQRISPTGDRVLFNRLMDDGSLDLYIYDFARDQINRLTWDGASYDAEWSPDGRDVMYNTQDVHGRATYRIATDFSRERTKVYDGRPGERPHLCDWSPDGATLFFVNRAGEDELWSGDADGNAEIKPYIRTELREQWLQISPDSSLMAYMGFEGGRRQAYVQHYPRRGPLLRVSRTGGGEVRWSPDSRTLFFREDGRIYRATIATEPELTVTELVALPLVDDYDSAASGHQHYDLSTDGRRFLMVRHGRRDRPTHVKLVEHWSAAPQGAEPAQVATAHSLD